MGYAVWSSLIGIATERLYQGASRPVVSNEDITDAFSRQIDFQK